MKIKNFTFHELISTSHKEIDNIPKDMSIIENLCVLGHFLQEVRDELGLPITVSSGYRCEQLNTKIGGATGSHHIEGRSADIKCSDMNKLYKILDRRIAELDEFGVYINKDGSYRWFHITTGSPKPRQKRYSQNV